MIFSLLGTLSILIYAVSLDPVYDQRDGLRPREGISIGHNDEIHMTDIKFYFINTRDTDSIELRYNMEYLEHSAPGKVGIYFPYSIEITSNSTGWERVEVDSGTAFMKKYECDEEEYCKSHFNEQPIFTLTPEYSKFDTKNRHIHGIKIGIDNTDPPDADRFFRENNMRDFPLTFSYDDSTNREVTIVIPRTSDNIHPIPDGEPGIFHNSGIDYSNNRISWTLDKNEHAFFLDYEMPNERASFEASKVLMTLSGIVLGMLIGAAGIAIAFFKKRDDDESKKQTLDAITSTADDTVQKVVDVANASDRVQKKGGKVVYRDKKEVGADLVGDSNNETEEIKEDVVAVLKNVDTGEKEIVSRHQKTFSADTILVNKSEQDESEKEVESSQKTDHSTDTTESESKKEKKGK